MAQRAGKDFLVALIAGYDIRPYTNELPTFRREKVVEDRTVLGVADQLQSAVLRRAALAHKGFYDDQVLASVDALSQLNDSPVVGCWALAGNVLGSPFTGFSGQLQQNFERPIKTGALTHADAAWAISGVVDEGVVLYPQGPANSASGSGAVHDNGADTVLGGAVYLQIPALVLGDRTNLVATVSHSPDNVTFSTLATFTAVTAAPAAQRIPVSGTIFRYTKLTYAYGGGTSGQSATLFAGIERNALNTGTPGPLSISGLQLWLKADAIQGLADGAAVAAWPDSSGNGFNAAQAVGANQPTYKVNILNGLPAVRFDGVASFMSLAGAALSMLNNANGVTSIIVSKVTNVTANLGEAFCISNNQSAGSRRYSSAHAAQAQEIVFRRLDADGASTLASGNVLTTAQVGCEVRRVDATTQTATIRLNGVQTASNGAFGTGPGQIQNLSALAATIGSVSSGAGGFYPGDIEEIIVYNKSLSDAEVAVLETHLQAKYGLVF